MGALSRGLLAILAVELVCYGAIVLRLHPAIGWGASAAVVAAIGLSLRAVPILLSYAIAVAFASPVPPDLRIGVFARVRYAAQEVGITVLLYTVLQPFERWIVPGQASPSGDGVPVLLIHGYLCNRAVWWSLRRWLVARGHPVFLLDLEPVFGDIDGYADPIARHIEAARRTTGAEKVTLIGGSMGGLAIRAYLRAHGSERVGQVITLGTPHHGSMLARFALGRNGRQMRQGSQWLATLAEQHSSAVPLVSIYSCHDNLVAPQSSSRLEGATNRALAGIGHLSLAFAGPVREVLAEFL